MEKGRRVLVHPATFICIAMLLSFLPLFYATKLMVLVLHVNINTTVAPIPGSITCTCNSSI